MFWDYVRKKLAFIPVLTPGPIAALVEGAATNLDTARADILALRGAMMPETAEPDYLSIIARQRGILRWPDESLDAFRVRVTIAWLYWKTGGNPLGLEEVLHAFGYQDVDVIEHTDDIWAETTVAVKMEMAHAVPNTSYLVRLINDVKPARTRLRGLNLFSGESAALNAGPTVIKTHTQNQLTTGYDGQQRLPVYCGGIVFGGQRTAITSTTRASPIEGVMRTGGVTRGLMQACITPNTLCEGHFRLTAGCLVKTTIRCEIEG